MYPIQYDHKRNREASPEGARRALRRIFELAGTPTSLLDVGCGPGIWLCAAAHIGVVDLYGIDGVESPVSEFMIDRTRFSRIDLETNWQLGRRFDMALCLEVAEHLSEASADILIEALTVHTDTICFSAACPGQGGQHHVNLQWPAYWQALFNKRGFRCEDAIRWSLWQDPELLPWYRQNTFLAIRDPNRAGNENRIHPVIHPSMLEEFGLGLGSGQHDQILQQIAEGSQCLEWYLSIPIRGVFAKARRALFERRS
jgi:hypothetical protein